MIKTLTLNSTAKRMPAMAPAIGVVARRSTSMGLVLWSADPFMWPPLGRRRLVGIFSHVSRRGRDDAASSESAVAFTAVDDRRPPLAAYAALLGTTTAFGFSFVATKFALRGFEPLLIALLRFTLAGAILYVLWRLRGGRERLTRRELARLAALGFVSLTVYFTFENLGIARTSASDAAILIGAIPIFVSVLNVFTLHERNSGAQWTGILLSFAGVVALIELGAKGAGGSTLLGNLLVLGASLAAAVYNVAARRLLVTRSALFVTTFQNLFGALFMLPLAVGGGPAGRRALADRAGRRRRRLSRAGVLGVRLSAPQLRSALHRGEQGERVHQPHPRGGRRGRLRSPGGTVHGRPARRRGRRRRRCVAHQPRRPRHVDGRRRRPADES